MKEDKKASKVDASQPKDNSRRSFVKKVGAGTAGILAAGTAPYAYSATNPVKWRLQTYSGAPLGAHVILPQIESFNKAAHGRMEIELYYADQLVATDELFRALQNGTIDAVTMRPWRRRWTSAYSAVTFRSPRVTASTCRCCSSTTA